MLIASVVDLLKSRGHNVCSGSPYQAFLRGKIAPNLYQACLRTENRSFVFTIVQDREEPEQIEVEHSRMEGKTMLIGTKYFPATQEGLESLATYMESALIRDDVKGNHE